MRYSYEFKLRCVELYRQGKYPETPEGLSKEDPDPEGKFSIKPE